MRGSLAGAILGAYGNPRRAMARQVACGLSEPRALSHLMLACALLLVASLPNALRQARTLAIDDPVAGAVAAHLFGYLVVLPLLFYAAAALLHLAAWAFGGRGGFLAARAALFWSALVGAPIALALALAGVAAEARGAGPITTWLGYAALAFWLWLLAASLAEAEGFAGTGRVAAVLAGAVAAIAGLMHLAAGGGATAG